MELQANFFFKKKSNLYTTDFLQNDKPHPSFQKKEKKIQNAIQKDCQLSLAFWDGERRWDGAGGTAFPWVWWPDPGRGKEPGSCSSADAGPSSPTRVVGARGEMSPYSWQASAASQRGLDTAQACLFRRRLGLRCPRQKLQWKSSRLDEKSVANQVSWSVPPKPENADEPPPCNYK